MKTIATILSFFFIVGCSSGPYKYDPTKSAALNYATAGGVVGAGKQIKDVPREQVKQALERDGFDPDTELAVGVGLASAKYAGLMAATPGISNALGGSLFFLKTLFTGSYQPHLSPGYFGWMPVQMASNEEEALIKLENILVNAFRESLPSNVTLRKQTRKYNPPLGFEYEQTHYILEGDRKNCILKEGEDACAILMINREPAVAQAPDFLGAGQSYYWSRRKGESLLLFGVNTFKFKEAVARYMRGISYYSSHEFRQKMSSHLPAWIYYYMPPTKERPYPVILNQGKTYYFIEPATTQAEKT